MMIDSNVAMVGSANMDIRSFEDNFEVAAFIYDSQITLQLEKNFLSNLAKSQTITSQSWSKRPLKNSYKEALARLISPLF